MSKDWVTLNVGGQRFTTCRYKIENIGRAIHDEKEKKLVKNMQTFYLTRSTLFREPGCMLARMFANEAFSMMPSCQDETGAYLIDR
jgi:hypothetical protein